MRQLLVVFLLGMLCASCEQMFSLGGRGVKRTTREIQSLNGPVRSVFIAVAVPVNRDGRWEPGGQQPVSVTVYDKRGNRTEHTLYTAEGTIASKILFAYDEQGNETEAV